MPPAKVRFIWPAVSEEKIFYKLTNQKQELPVAACLLMDRDKISNLYRGR
jgi:hypothetical protein